MYNVKGICKGKILFSIPKAFLSNTLAPFLCVYALFETEMKSHAWSPWSKNDVTYSLYLLLGDSPTIWKCDFNVFTFKP